MLLLEQDITRKKRVDKKVRQIEFNAGNNDSRKYKVKAIWDSAVYTKESESGHLLSLYYLVLWKRYSEKENIWKPVSAIQQLRKLISLIHKNYLDKPIATSLTIDIALPMVRLTVKPIEPPKQKRD